MKFNYQFSNLCGVSYKSGNLLFTPDGNCLLSPVGNRVTVFDLVNHTSITMPFETRKNIAKMALTSDSKLLLVVDVDGHGLLVNYFRRTVIHRFNFKEKVKFLAFSPCDKYVAVGCGRKIHVWQTPQVNKEFSPFVLHRIYTGHHDDISYISWEASSRYFVAGGKDSTVRIYSLNPEKDFTVVTLTGHRGKIVGCFMFLDHNLDDEKTGPAIYTVCSNGALIVWKWVWERNAKVEPGEPLSISKGEWRKVTRHFLQKGNARIQSVALHANRSDLLVIGFDNGVFSLFEMPSATHIQSLSVSQHELKSIAINCTGEWLAMASAQLGQLLVWEWQSETYVLKQQGHFFDLNACAYSPDGQLVATGGDDSKVKVWSTTSGFCFVTFTEHTAPVTAITFIGEGNAVLSASMDGTVRAFDLVRYRNFRTMEPPRPVQLTCLAVDGQGEIVCAGAMDPAEIYVWSLQTGKLLDVLAGHDGPVASLSFSALTPTLASTSWDKTLRMWEPYKSTAPIESMVHGSDVLCVAFRPDGKQVCTGTLSGQLVFWDIESGKQVALIEGSHDISGGRLQSDRTSAKNAAFNKHFSSVCYTADGTCVIAGGRSKYVCIYQVEQQILLKKFQLSHNRSLDGVLDELHSGRMTEAGAIDEFDVSDNEESDDGISAKAKAMALPGATRAEMGKRTTKCEIRTKCIQFSPNGQEWAAATTEGLLIYALDSSIIFEPFQLDQDVTPDKIRQFANEGNYSQALVLSLHLGESDVIEEVFRAVPLSHLQLVARSVPVVYLNRLLGLIASELLTSPQIERLLAWLLALLTCHQDRLRTQAPLFMRSFRALQKSLSKHSRDLSSLCNQNMYGLSLLMRRGMLHDKSTGDKTEGLQNQTLFRVVSLPQGNDTSKKAKFV